MEAARLRWQGLVLKLRRSKTDERFVGQSCWHGGVSERDSQQDTLGKPEEQEFAAPVLHGRRFEHHSVPLDVLRELEAYERLILEVAPRPSSWRRTRNVSGCPRGSRAVSRSAFGR